MSQSLTETRPLLKRLPLRYSLRSLLMLPVIWALGWWWVTWPQRTADTFVRLINENKWDEASRLTATPADRDFIVQLGDYVVSEVQEGRRDLQVRPLDRSWSDMFLGRQVFGFGMDTSYVVQRGRVSLGFD